MPGRAPDTDRDDCVSYTFEPERDLWSDWRDTVSRSTPLYARLNRLLELDAANDLDALVDGDATPTDTATPDAVVADADTETVADAIDTLVDDAEPESVPLTAVRIRRRCASGVQNARAEGADDAAEALTEIKQLADGLLGDD